MNMKKILSIFLALTLMLGTIPGMSFAVSAEDEPAAEPAAETVTITNQQTSGTMTVSLTVPARDPIPYLDADGTEKQTGPDCYDVYTTDTSLGIKSTEQWYVVCESTTLTADSALTIYGDVKLVICDGATLTVPHGINLDNGSITIYAQSTDEQTMGKLVANAHNDSCAAIGSSASKTPGTITVNGGNITATGGANSAAIGGGSGSKNVNVTINGGVVTATGGANSAAIGGGAGATNVNVSVNGGVVNATGGANSAAISGTLTVSDGAVTANGGGSVAALSGTLTVNGGEVTATGGANSAAISGTLTVSDGAVTANGGGSVAALSGTLTVNGGKVTANGSGSVAALSGTLTVNGGEVTATGGENGAAISGSITVNGGTVTADAANGAAIDCDLTVSGGVVTATGGGESAAINGNLTVEGGDVTVDNANSTAIGGNTTVSDGTVNVTGGGDNAAINGNLTVEGGDVTVDSANSTAIGGELTVNGGTVTATGAPALSGNPTVADDMFAKAGDSEAAAVVTDLDQLDDKNYVLITPKYTITWKNEDGTVLVTTKVREGEIPTTYIRPDKPSDEQGNYGFTGWTPAVVAATADATYTATYKLLDKLTISQGQYIRLGYYNGKPVDWYCQRINGTGTMMLCKYALKSSSFGSNATYKESNVHAWLDVDSGGSFVNDIGLTSTELSLVRTLDLSSSGGDGTDRFIIPAYGNDELNSGQKVHAPYKFGTNTLVDQYWLRTARDSSNERIINHSKDGMPIATVSARYSGVGNSRWIRPMFYLDTNAIKNMKYTGSGTEEDPYELQIRYDLRGSVSSAGGGKIIADIRQNRVTGSGSSSVYQGEPPVSVVPNSTVYLSFTPDTGYKLKSYKIIADNGNSIDLKNNSYINMPNCGVTVTAEFEKQKFDVTWKNYDGTVLETDKNVEYGTMPTYDGETPSKPGGEHHYFDFTGWTPEISAVTGAATYTATYTRIAHVASVIAGENTTSYYDFEEALENWTDGSTLMLLEDVSHSDGIDIPADTSKTLDLNGKTLTAGVTVNGTLTIQSSVQDGNISPSDKAQVISVSDGATLNISSGTINGYNADCAVIGGTGTFNMNGGVIATPASNAFSLGSGAALSLNAGEIRCTSNSTSMETASAIWADGNSTINWSGTAITTNTGDGIRMKSAGNGVVNVSGGSFTATNSSLPADGGYAIYDDNIGTLNLKGAPNLEGKGIYLADNKIINITDTLSNTTPITVTMQTPDVFTSGLLGNGDITNFACNKGYEITLNAEGEAQIDPILYTITWKDDDGSTIDTTTVAYSDTPTHADPTKDADEKYTYIFAGWTPEVKAVTGDATYTATYTTNPSLVGSHIETPARLATNTMSFPNCSVYITGVTGTQTIRNTSVTYYRENYDRLYFNGQFILRQYNPPEGIRIVSGSGTPADPYVTEWYTTPTITWKLDENTVIDTTRVYYGLVPTHAVPTKADEVDCSYTFSGWTDGTNTYGADDPLPAVSGNTTYTAIFTPGPRAYNINVTAEHGTVTANPAKTPPGTQVTLTAKPDSGYLFSSIKASMKNTDSHQVSLSALSGSSTGGEGYDKLVDDDTDTKWGFNGGSGYIIVKADKAILLRGYSLTTANDTDEYPGRNWKNWNIYGANFASDRDASQNSNAWKLVDSVTDDSTLEDTSYTEYDFSVNTASEEYQYYKIEISANQGDGYTQMSELTMSGSNGEIEIPLTQDSANPTKYTFEMPASDVTVKAEFREANIYTVTWKDGDDVLETDDGVLEGTVPTYDSVELTNDSRTFIGWTDGKNTYAPDALPEVTGDVTYTAVFHFNDGVGARVAGYTLSLEGDVAVNFYMELDPTIAASETAYMHFMIPNGSKTTELDVPVSQATVKGKYYIFKCSVAAKDMNATVTGQIIDGEKHGDKYTYSVRDYADYLFDNADENGTDLQKEYAKAAPLVEKMLNYGAYAQKYFAPNTADEDLANVGHVVDISGVTADMIGKSAYTENLNGVAEFSGATLSLKSQTTLSLYFTSDEELTFNCNYEYETEKQDDYQIIRIRNIHARNLNYDFKVTVSAGGKSGTVRFSPMNYCYNVLNDSSYDAKLQNVVKALYLYYQGANAYFPAPVHVHIPGAVIIENEVPGTCAAAGSHVEVVFCSECDEEISRETVVDKVEHQMTAHAEVPATYEASGAHAYYECSVCHKLFTDAEGNNETTAEALVIPKLEKNYVLDDLTEDIIVQDGFTVTGTLRGDHKISIADGATVTLKDVDITCLSNDNETANFAGITLVGDATIMLEGANTVKGGHEDYPGIYVPENKTLTINGTGSLDASSNGYACGIGGGYEIGAAGNIVINGGTVTAYGGDCSAGIGSGEFGSCGGITISGGTVTANGGDYGAGIGSGSCGECGNITIKGGTVTANGGDSSAGIGSGESGSCGNINITGGTVTAIGGGSEDGDYGAGIGTGYSGTCGNITIAKTVTKVTATKGGEDAASIGKGCEAESCGTISIAKGANVIQN